MQFILQRLSQSRFVNCRDQWVARDIREFTIVWCWWALNGNARNRVPAALYGRESIAPIAINKSVFVRFTKDSESIYALRRPLAVNSVGSRPEFMLHVGNI